MKFKTSIIKLPDKEYLAIRGFLSWGEIKREDLPEWNEKYGFPDKSRIDELKIKSGSDVVLSLFCNSCRKDDKFSYVCGDDLACENINKAEAGDGFEIIRLAASEYFKIEYLYEKGLTVEEAWKEVDNFFWNDWLVNNPYKSKIDGINADNPETADILLLDEKGRCVTVWHPIIAEENI